MYVYNYICSNDSNINIINNIIIEIMILLVLCIINNNNM